MRRIAAALAFYSLAACTTQSPHKVVEIEDELDVKGQAGDDKVGLNKEGEAVIQQERDAAEELAIQRSANAYLVERLATDHHDLKRCVKDIADPRLGGKGEWGKLPDIDTLRPSSDASNELGVDGDGKLKVVKKTFYRDELKAERQYETTLRSMHKLVQEQLERCEFELGLARNRAGLPADRYAADGYFTGDGTWIETRKGEQSVSDAFEIQAGHKKRAEAKLKQKTRKETRSVETTVEDNNQDDNGDAL